MKKHKLDIKGIDNLGNKVVEGDHVGYIYGKKGHYRIHSGIIKKLCERTAWIEPDEDFKNDCRRSEHWYEYHETVLNEVTKTSKYDKFYLANYKRIVKLGY